MYLCGSCMCLCTSVCRAAVGVHVSSNLLSANILKCTSMHKLLSSLCFSMTVKCASVSSRSLARVSHSLDEACRLSMEVCNYSLKLWCGELHRHQIVLSAVRLLDVKNKGSVMSRSRPSRKGKSCVRVLIEYELLVVVTAVAGADPAV